MYVVGTKKNTTCSLIFFIFACIVETMNHLWRSNCTVQENFFKKHGMFIFLYNHRQSIKRLTGWTRFSVVEYLAHQFSSIAISDVQSLILISIKQVIYLLALRPDGYLWCCLIIVINIHVIVLYYYTCNMSVVYSYIYIYIICIIVIILLYTSYVFLLLTMIVFII